MECFSVISFLPALISGYRSSGILRGTSWQLFTDVGDRCIIPKLR